MDLHRFISLAPKCNEKCPEGTVEVTRDGDDCEKGCCKVFCCEKHKKHDDKKHDDKHDDKKPK